MKTSDTEDKKLIDSLALVPYNSKAMSTTKAYKLANEKRVEWALTKKLTSPEESLLLYMAEKAKTVGSSALATISAAYQAANETCSSICQAFVTDLIKATRRKETEKKKEVVEVEIQDIEKIVKLALDSNEPSLDRDALIAVLSFKAMLRASEAANLEWSDVRMEQNMIEVKIKRAKNDQMALGRLSFFEYEAGSDEDILMCRWRLRKRGNCQHVFSTLHGAEPLSAASISSLASKMLSKIGKFGATHHCFRRSGANYLQSQGFSFEEIQKRGRWRSQAGLQRYLKDSPRAQGCLPKPMLEPYEQLPTSSTTQALPS
uniref:Tyr recombinase domain-containing protein n=1 Tax=Caenorhabditis japonica TaxID=281687 RepID=A0A8R1DJN3_CAEJA